LLAIVPAVLVILIMGEEMVDSMLVFSQVLLSMQLAFAVIPLIHFVSDKKRMGKYAIGKLTKSFAWLIAAVIVTLNLKLVYETALDWMGATDSILLKALIVGGEIGLVILLAVTIFHPFRLQRREASINVHKDVSMDALHTTVSKPFHRIALAVDYSSKDERVLQYAIQLGDKDTEYTLIHIVESAQARMMEDQAQDYETIKDKEHLQAYVNFLTERGHKAEGLLGFKNRAKEIARIMKEKNCDLLIVGSHGHKNISDWIFGETINSVRHMVDVPVFIAR
jgi:manganese transport protein